LEGGERGTVKPKVQSRAAVCAASRVAAEEGVSSAESQRVRGAEKSDATKFLSVARRAKLEMPVPRSSFVAARIQESRWVLRRMKGVSRVGVEWVRARRV